jgi:hypothetical protein
LFSFLDETVAATIESRAFFVAARSVNGIRIITDLVGVFLTVTACKVRPAIFTARPAIVVLSVADFSRISEAITAPLDETSRATTVAWLQVPIVAFFVATQLFIATPDFALTIGATRRVVLGVAGFAFTRGNNAITTARPPAQDRTSRLTRHSKITFLVPIHAPITAADDATVEANSAWRRIQPVALLSRLQFVPDAVTARQVGLTIQRTLPRLGWITLLADTAIHDSVAAFLIRQAIRAAPIVLLAVLVVVCPIVTLFVRLSDTVAAGQSSTSLPLGYALRSGGANPARLFAHAGFRSRARNQNEEAQRQEKKPAKLEFDTQHRYVSRFLEP